MDHSYYTERDKLQKTDHCYFTIAKKTPKVVLRRAQLLKEHQERVTRTAIGQDHAYVRSDHVTSIGTDDVCDYLPTSTDSIDVTQLTFANTCQQQSTDEDSVTSKLDLIIACARLPSTTVLSFYNNHDDGEVKNSNQTSTDIYSTISPDHGDSQSTQVSVISPRYVQSAQLSVMPTHDVQSIRISAMSSCDVQSARLSVMSSFDVLDTQEPVMPEVDNITCTQHLMMPSADKHNIITQQEVVDVPSVTQEPVMSSINVHSAAQKPVMSSIDVPSPIQEPVMSSIIVLSSTQEPVTSSLKDTTNRDVDDIDSLISGIQLDHTYDITLNCTASSITLQNLHLQRPWSYSDDFRITGRLVDMEAVCQSCFRLDDHTYLGTLPVCNQPTV